MGAKDSKNNFNCNCIACDNLDSKKFRKYQEFLGKYNFYTKNKLFLEYTDCLCSCSNSVKRFSTSIEAIHYCKTQKIN